MKMIKNFITPVSVSLSLFFLTGCGGGEVSNPGINTGSDTTVDPIFFEDIQNVKFRIENEGTANEVLVPFYYLAGKVADEKVQFLTAPITGLGNKDRVDVSVLSVNAVKGSVLDPDLFAEKVKKGQERNRCLARNENAVAEFREPEICNKEQAVAACNKDISNALDPLLSCSEQPDPFGINYLDIVPVTDPDVFKYKIVAATDAFGEFIDISSDKLATTYIMSGNERVGQESAFVPVSQKLSIGQNSQLRLMFDLPDEAFYWDNMFQAVMQVGDQKFDVMFSTNVRKPEIADPSAKFIDQNFLNIKPGRVITTPIITFEGHNTRAPLQLETDGTFTLEYSVNGSEFITMTGNSTPLGSCDDIGVVCVRGGGSIQLRVATVAAQEVSISDPAYERSYDVTVRVGEGLNNSSEPAPNTLFENVVKIKTHSWDYVPGPKATLQFPNRSSLTLSESASIRGTIELTEEMKDFSHEDLTAIPEGDFIRPTTATLYKYDESGSANDPSWTPISITFDNNTGSLNNNIVRDAKDLDLFHYQFKSVPVPLGEEIDSTTKKYQFYLVVESNVSRVTGGIEFTGKSEPVRVNVERRSAMTATSTFPAAASTSMLKNLKDGSINPKNGLLYLTDDTSNNADANGGGGQFALIWRYNLDADSKPSCTVRPMAISFSEGRGVGGIQFNSQRPELGGAIIKVGQGPIYLTEEQLHLGPTATYSLVLNKTDWAGNAGREARMYAWDYKGQWIYSNSHNRVYNNTALNQQQFINAMSFNTETKLVDGKMVDVVLGMERLGPSGKVAQEVEDPSGRNHNGIALDIMTFEKGTDAQGNRVAEEWILSLDMKNNDLYYKRNGVGVTQTMGVMNLRKLKMNHGVAPDYSNPLSNWSDVELLLNGNPITISDGHAIAIDDKRQKAYIVDNFVKKIYEVDLSNLAISNVLTVTRVLVDNATSPIKFEQIESFVMEGGIDYLVAIDGKQRALLVIDPVTGEMAYALRALGTKTDANKSVCDQ